MPIRPDALVLRGSLRRSPFGAGYICAFGRSLGLPVGRGALSIAAAHKVVPRRPVLLGGMMKLRLPYWQGGGRLRPRGRHSGDERVANNAVPWLPHGDAGDEGSRVGEARERRRWCDAVRCGAAHSMRWAAPSRRLSKAARAEARDESSVSRVDG